MIETVLILLTFVCVVAIGYLSRLERAEASKYKVLKVFTANHTPERDFPESHSWPDIYVARDVIFDAIEGARPAHIVRVEHRPITVAELREMEGRN